MKGLLEVCLDPACIGFVSASSGKRKFRNSQASEIRNLLVDLRLIKAEQFLPNEECLIRLNGDFSARVICNYGLMPWSEANEGEGRAQDDYLEVLAK